MLVQDSVSLSAEWGHSYPPVRKPKEASSAGSTETCSLVLTRPPWLHTLPLCPAPDVGGHGHCCPQVQDPAHCSSRPKPRAMQRPPAWVGRVGPPRDSWLHSALGKGPSMVTATSSKYRPSRPLMTHHCTWASLAPAGPARSGGGVVSGLARGLQVQSRAQARVSGPLSA